MARNRNKTCSNCGYQTHTLFDIGEEGEYGICANCVVDFILEVRDHPNQDGPEEVAYVVSSIVEDAEQA